jgi:TonB family protein
MKKARILIVVFVAFASLAGFGYFALPLLKSEKPTATKRAKAPKVLPKTAQQNVLPKSATPKLKLSQEELTKIGQALHERREKALKSKDHKALVVLGKEVRDGAAFPGYKKLAAMCFADAAKLRSTDGMMLAGWCAEKGFGIERNAKRAFDYYFEAGESGFAGGYNAAARMVLAGNNEVGDMDMATALIDKAMAMGSAEAKFLKGTLLLAEGSDVQAGLAYLTEAAQADYADAQRLLGQLYKEGKHVPKDLAAAAEWAKYAAALGSTSASVDYAILAMFKTPGTEGGARAGLGLLAQAANQGNATAAYRLASFYRGATGVSMQDVEKTRNYAAIAYENGETKAAFLMATTYPPEDNDTILEWIKKGDQVAEWRSRYATRLVENEGISAYDAVQLAMKATIEEARSYGLMNAKNLPADRTPPQVVSVISPVMPAALKAIDVNTVVKVQFLVNEDGIPVNIQVASPSTYEELDKAAVDAVAQWRYKPAMRSGVIVPAKITTPIRFRSSR